MYIHSSKHPFGSKARLLSNERAPTAKSCLSLWYHMYGRSMGNLYLKKRTGLSDSMLRYFGLNKYNVWLYASVPFSSSEPYQV